LLAVMSGEGERRRWSTGERADEVVRAVVRIGAPLNDLDICLWCEEVPDEAAEAIAEAGGSPVYEQAAWHAADCPWRQAAELLGGREAGS
jgi:hypothetical protein